MSGPFDPTHLDAIRRQLASLDELWRRDHEAVRAGPAPGSRAALDLALPDGRFVMIFASQSASAALDHLTAWRAIAHGPLIPISAHLTLIRSALDSADRCRWHLDPFLSPGQRVGRAIAARRRDQVDRSNFEASNEPEPRLGRPPTGKSALERLAELDDPEAVAGRLARGITAEHYAGATDVARLYGHERWFRLASGLAHGREWALGATRLDRPADSAADPKMGQGIFSASELVARAITIVAVRAAAAAIADLEAYLDAPHPA